MLAAIAGLFGALAWSGVAAQTISQPAFDGWLNSNNVGQSFQATLTGEVVAISIGSQSAQNVNLHIYNGATGSGLAGILGAPIYTQAVTLNASALGLLQRIDLTTPLPITAASSYTFILSGANSLSLSSFNPYANGDVVYQFGTPFPGFDLAFAVFEQVIAPPAAATAAAIPSSSTWSLIGAGAFIMAAALFQRRRTGRQSRP